MNVNDDLFRTLKNDIQIYDKIDAARQPGSSIDFIINDFLLLFNNVSTNDNVSTEKIKETKALASKIKVISDKKNEYYQSSYIGKISQLFSAIYNIYAFGEFISSAELGLRLAQRTEEDTSLILKNRQAEEVAQFLRQHQNQRREHDQGQANNTTWYFDSVQDLNEMTPAESKPELREDSDDEKEFFESLETQPTEVASQEQDFTSAPEQAADANAASSHHPQGLTSTNGQAQAITAPEASGPLTDEITTVMEHAAPMVNIPPKDKLKAAIMSAWPGVATEAEKETLVELFDKFFEKCKISSFEHIGENSFKINLENEAKYKIPLPGVSKIYFEGSRLEKSVGVHVFMTLGTTIEFNFTVENIGGFNYKTIAITGIKADVGLTEIASKRFELGKIQVVETYDGLVNCRSVTTTDEREEMSKEELIGILKKIKWTAY